MKKKSAFEVWIADATKRQEGKLKRYFSGESTKMPELSFESAFNAGRRDERKKLRKVKR